jgi:hypothetical protein
MIMLPIFGAPREATRNGRQARTRRGDRSRILRRRAGLSMREERTLQIASGRGGASAGGSSVRPQASPT